MRSFIFISLFFVGLFSYGQLDSLSAYDKMLNEHYERTVPFIQPKELYERLQAGETIYLLDTREGSEYKVSHLKGAIHVGFLFFSKNRVSEVPKKSTIVLYCTVGVRSEGIGERLNKKGYTNVYNLYGGIIHWKNRGYPVYVKGKETEEVHVYSKKWGKWLTNGKPRY